MPEVEVEDPLSKRTARLSISTFDVESENPRVQVREFLKSSEMKERRDSAVSLSSLNEDELHPLESAGSNSSSDSFKTPNKGSKRRRSSAQSSTAATNAKKLLKSTEETSPKKVHKKKQKKARMPPSVKISLEEEEGNRVSFRTIRELVLKVFNCSSDKTKCFKLTNQNSIPKLVFCFVPGLPIHVDQESSKPQLVSTAEIPKINELSFLFENFDNIIPTSCPGSNEAIYSPLQTITNIPLTKKEKKDILDKSKNTKITIYDLLMTDEQLSSHNYPMEIKDEVKDQWVETKEFDHEGSHTFALDCEFCQAESGKVLTRISIINFQGEVVLDKLVKPKEEITDYLTKYSGITEKKLEDVTTTLEDIQKEVVSIISKDDVLIGHSLESDLNVMRVKHSKIVDTAVIFEHSRGPPSKPSLKWLTQKYLNRQIQCGENTGDGHSSVEDSQACLDLVKLKIQEGRCFGLNVGEVSIFQRLAIENSTSEDDFQSLWINYSQYKDQESYNEPSANHVKRVYVRNDDDVVAQFKKEAQDKRFVVLSLRELEFNFGLSTPPAHYTGKISENVDKEALLSETNKRLDTIYQCLPENSMMIVYSVVGDPADMYRLQGVRRNFQALEREGVELSTISKEESWDFDKVLELKDATTRAKEAITFIGIKQASYL
ncbi:uncharacterized protein RJT20DRAFT_34426 [Scheffersomyces xylosifermentans]|uniref:uncharacterized protein n=1 Tax=Scheffersomyces xylosifermentans TaxID=1304137 RepID=UPI00315D1AAC